MKTRIAIWACSGFLVAGGWGIYFTIADKEKPVEPLVYILAEVSQPVAAVVARLDFPVGLSWVLVVNVVTYALAGSVVETLRRKRKRAN